MNDKKVPHPRGDVRAIMLQATVNNWRECGSLRVRFFGQRAFDDAHHSIPTPVRCPEVNWIPCSGFQLTYFKAVAIATPPVYHRRIPRVQYIPSLTTSFRQAKGECLRHIGHTAEDSVSWILAGIGTGRIVCVCVK